MQPPTAINEFQADLANDDLATAQTIQMMCQQIREAVPDPAIQRVVHRLLRTSDLSSRVNACHRIWQWCKDNIRFVPDEWRLALLGKPDERELLTSPSVMIRSNPKEGDCDCIVETLCTMLAIAGVTPLLKTFKCDRQNPNRWSHICAAAVLEDGTVFPLDASHGSYPGWEVPKHDQFQVQLWDMNGNPVGGDMQQQTRGGLGSYDSLPSWTGNPLTTLRGPLAGPYQNQSPRDVRSYYQRNRRAGLGAIARGKYGLGACDFTGPNGELVCDSAGLPSSDISVGTLPDLSVTAPTSSPSSSGSSFNWNSFFSNLLGDATRVASTAVGSGQAQNLGGGKVLLPSGQIVSTGSGISSSTILIAALVIGGLLIFSKK